MEAYNFKVTAIILAGGSGVRFGMDIPKQFIKLAGKTIIEHTIDVFEKSRLVDEIYIVVNPHWYEKMYELLKRNNHLKVKKLLKGGSTRQESSRIGVYATDKDTKYILIHDAVRPFVTEDIIKRVIDALEKYPAVDTVIPTADTIVKIKDEEIDEIPNRKILRRGQTPQGFSREVILKAHRLAEKDGINDYPDDCSLVLKYHLGKVGVVEGDVNNIKITYQKDVYLADRLFQLRRKAINLKNREEILTTLKKIQGKVVVVFGGTEGIGKEIVRIGNKYGAKAYPYSRRNGADIRKLRDVEKALKEVYEKEGKIDAVINTAGILKMGFIKNAEIDKIRDVIEINYMGAINVTKASIPYLERTKGHLILFTSSSYTRGREGYSIYSSTKAAVVNFMQAVADELSELKIKVNAICPERTATPMRFKNFGKEPPQTLLKPETVAYITLLTINSDISGQVIDVRKNREENKLQKFKFVV